MPLPERTRAYVAAVVGVALAFAIRTAMTPVIGPSVAPVQLFYLAVFVAAWLGGLWPGLLATTLSIAVAYPGFIAPATDPSRPFISVFLTSAIFVAIGATISWLSEARRRALERERQHAEQLRREQDRRAASDAGAAEQRERVRQTQAELKRFAFLVESASDFIGICDLDFRPIYVNAAGCRLVGIGSVADVQDRPITDFFFPDDVPYLESTFFPTVLRDGHAQIEVRFRHFATGEPLWMLYGVALLRDADGEVTGYATISSDLTDRKRTEDIIVESRERLRAALDASETGTFRWDIRTNEVHSDANLDRLFGFPESGSTRPVADYLPLIHEDDRARFLEACRLSAEHGADFKQEFRVLRSDGTERWLLDKGRTYPGADGRAAYLTGACVDITERRQKEDALRTADRHKDEFLGMLAHELRNPLAPIMYSVSVLERQMPSPEAKRPLEIISRQVRRMTRLVDDLLDVSRVTQGKISLQREELDLGALLRQAADAFRASMDQRGHQLEVTLPAEPVMVTGDPARLGQIFENLLSNAAKYTPPGGRVRVTLSHDGANAIVSVMDTGVGITAEALPRVFDLFMQADTSLDRSEGGLGIGLTLVERLARLHDGSVAARSDGQGQGSEFVVRLPLATAEPAPLGGGSRGSGGLITTRRFLVVDDNLDSTEALRLLLEMRGHTVHVVHDGPAALDAARRLEPDAVLLDVGLPGLNGFEVVKRLRAVPETAALLVIATTGYGREEDRARCLAAGFNDHVTKPVDVDQIERLVSPSPPSPDLPPEGGSHAYRV